MKRAHLEWLATKERWAADAPKLDVLAQLALSNMTKRQDDLSLIGSAGISTRRSNPKEGPKVLIKSGAETIGNLDVTTGMLTVPHVDRAAVSALLVEKGIEFRRSLTPILPAPGTDIYLHRGVVKVRVNKELFSPTGTSEVHYVFGPEVAALRLETGELILTCPRWEQTARHLLAFHGVEAKVVLDLDSDQKMAEALEWNPDAYPPRLSRQEARERFYADPTISDHLKALAKTLGEREDRRATEEAKDLARTREPSERLRTELPSEVVLALESLFAHDAASKDRWSIKTLRGHDHRCLTQESLDLLTAITPPTDLPEGFTPIDTTLTPVMGPKLLAMQLRQDHRDWWAALPWDDAPLVDSSGQRTSDLRFVTRKSVARSTQPKLIAELGRVGSDLGGYCSWPVELSVNEEVRAVLALSALYRCGVIGAFDPSTKNVCEVCSLAFDATSNVVHRVPFVTTEMICRPCTTWAIFGAPSWGDDYEAAAPAALRVLADQLGTAPSQSMLRTSIGVDPREAAIAVACRMILPRVLPRESAWIEWLEKAGLVGDAGWRGGRGYVSRAKDGHLCRSLFERHVDDYLTDNSIEHECEPYWPQHDLYNPTGLRRADWRIGDNVYVEAAGMMSRPDYAEKMQEKTALAHATGIRLITLVPENVGELTLFFEEFQSRST